MRPRRLVLQAFGPFASRQEVDFDLLATRGVFLVGGATGAGKSSLLDALTYALYGAVPGARDRHRDRLRSDHAPPELETSVELEVALAGDDWRVTRRPPHERAKRRGSGTTQLPAKATLARRTANGWATHCTGVVEVSDEIRRLVGLSAEQFTQVVVLPQGQVQQALMAEGRQRERLLGSLFSTARYAALTSALAERARVAEQRASAQRIRIEEARARFGRAVGALEGAVRLPEDPIAAPEQTRAVLAAAAARVTARRQETQARLSRARLQREEGEAVTARLERREAAVTALDAARREAATCVAHRARLQDAAAAAQISPLLRRATTATAAERGARDAADRSRMVLREARARPLALPGLPPPGEGLPLADLRDRARDLIAVVEAADEDGASARRLAEEASRAQTAAAERAERASSATERAGALEVRERHLSEELEGAVAAAARLPDEDGEAARRQAEVEAGRMLAALLDREDAVADSWRDARDAHAGAQAAVLALWHEQLESMAGALAVRLVPGSPCAVCGAIEHPEPAAAADAPGEEELAEAERLRDRRAEETEAARTAHQEIVAEIVRHRALAGTAADDLEAAREAARAAAEAAAGSAACAARQPGLRRSVREVREAARAARDEAGSGLEEAAALRATADALGVESRALEQRAVQRLGGPPSPTLQRDLTDLVAAVEGAQHAEEALERAAAAAASAVEEARAAALAAGFTDAAAAHGATLAPEERARLEAEVHEVETAQHEAAAVLRDPALADLPSTPPPIAALRHEEERAAAAHETAVEAGATLTLGAAELTDALHEHAERTVAHAPLAEEAGRLRRLAEVTSGSGNALRVSLERYVLGAFLAEIAERASRRLGAMSDGRYALLHSEEREKGGAPSGLGIRVRDAWTGAIRDVGSLSGGETFQASLALALGIADAVTAHAGGVRLDALFVDEGFGSLDPEALELAITELDRLREGGRLVGVISHVATLQERLGTGLHVAKGRGGSAVRSLVGV